MPRLPRGYSPGHAYHVLNRGNGGAHVFHKDADYAAFLELLGVAKAQHPVNILGFCVMPNHFHLVVAPITADGLSPFMQWWMTSHVRRYHRHYRSHGHVWQGRFKSFPIQQDHHLLTVLRYVLLNPVRAKFVDHARDWRWSSLHFPALTDPLPIPLPTDEPSDQSPDLHQSPAAVWHCGLASENCRPARPRLHAASAWAPPQIPRKVACPLFSPFSPNKVDGPKQA